MHPVPYKSEPDAMPDLLSGRVHMMFGTSTSVGAHVKEGKLRVLATTLNERSPLMPDVRRFPETGQEKLPIGPLVRPGRASRTAARDRDAHEQGGGGRFLQSRR